MKTFGLIILLCGLTGLLVYAAMGGFGQRAGEKDKGTLKTEEDFRNKLAEIRMNRNKLERAIDKQEESKQRNLEFLKSAGITKVADAKGNPSAEIALHNLKEWSESIVTLKSQFAQFDSASSRIEGILEKFERDRINESAVLTEDQQIELRAIVSTLDEKMNIGQDDILADSELDALLDKELNGPQ